MIAPRLSRENIVAVAIEMADEEGLPSVTLRGIASRLAVHVTSLYNHVPTKEAVIGGIVEALLTEARLPTEVGEFRLLGYRSLSSDEEFIVLTRGRLRADKPRQTLRAAGAGQDADLHLG